MIHGSVDDDDDNNKDRISCSEFRNMVVAPSSSSPLGRTTGTARDEDANNFRRCVPASFLL